ncbi:MAG: type II secretion system F family protein [Chloroflexota bacterium]|nr:type II secretion system F family protein [Chloroflexota bacterium]
MPPPEIIIAAIAGAAVLLVTFGLAVRPPQDAVQQRLSQLVIAPQTLEQMELQQPLFERTVRPMVKRLATLGRRSGGDQGGVIARTEARLERAGYPGGLRGADWVGVKLLVAIVLGIVLLIVGLPLVGPALGFLFGVVGLVFGYVIPEYWLGKRISKRSFDMVLQLPDALDLLIISVEAGLGFDAALAKVVEKMSGPLVDEFRQALAEVRMGRTRRDALRDVAKRADARPLSNFIGAIVQAEQLGVPIARVLQVQSQQLRIERRQRAEEAAAKAPIKMLFPMVGCIFPTIFIVILGPAVITVVKGIGI